MAPSNPPALRLRVRRAFAHEEMKKVCRQFQEGQIDNLSDALKELTTAPFAELATVADAFVDLQEARHSADYDASEVFSREDALSYVDLAEQAFGAWQAAKDTPNANVFLAALLLQRNWRSTT